MKLRRTMMYVTGNNAANVKDPQIYGADSLMFDLEDSIAVANKDAARLLVYHTLSTIDFSPCETVVRINGLDTPYGHEDLRAMVKARPDVIRLPKTETADDIKEVERIVSELESEYGYEQGTIKLMAAIESAKGVLNARDICVASDRLIGCAIGGEDFVTDIKTTRYADGVELLFARQMIIVACRAAGIYALDTVYADINNEEGFRAEVEHIKQLGFDGKSIIHPRQVRIVHEIFAPSEQDIDHAVRVLEGVRRAREKGLGVITVDGKMVDGPIIDRAARVVAMAEASGIKVEG